MVNKYLGEKTSWNLRFKYIATIILVIFASIVSANLEYNFILLDALPYREARQPTMGVFYYYHLEAIIPLIGLLAFQPFIYEVLSKTRSSEGLRTTFALGVGSLLLGLILEDTGWFVFRLFTPLSSDPLAYQWIRPSDYTASFVGYANIFGLIVPLWYMILIPPIVAILVALLIIPHR